MGEQIENLRNDKQFYQELAACEAWTALQAVKSAVNRMGEEWKDHLMIERRVNMMDPDFSFSEVMYDERMPSLCGQEHPK